MTFRARITRPLKKASRGQKISDKRIEQLNDMYWEQNKTRREIRAMGNSDAVLDRALFQTRAEWDRFRGQR